MKRSIYYDMIFFCYAMAKSEKAMHDEAGMKKIKRRKSEAEKYA